MMIKDIFSKIKQPLADLGKHNIDNDKKSEASDFKGNVDFNNTIEQTVPMTAYVSDILKSPESDELGMKAGYLTGIGARPQQQDSLLISDLSDRVLCDKNGVLALVADGMGGLADGAKISASITDIMNKLFSDVSETMSPQDRLLTMTYDTAETIRNYLINENAKMSGSTLAAVIIHNNELSFLSVGDSRIYLVRKGMLLQLNREHSYAVELDEAAARGEMYFEQAKNHPQRNALTSYIGNVPLERIDRSMHPIRLKKGDAVMIMSDGVFGTLSDEKIESIFVEDDPVATAKAIEREVLAAGQPNQDNFSAVILSV